MESTRYPTDLADDEWLCISPHLPEHACRGRPRLHGLRTILDALFYVLKSGRQWRMLPREFPPWKTVYGWFRRWRIDGTWEQLNAALRERVRARSGRRNPHPSAGIVDSRTIRTTGVGGQERGFDPAKRVGGRKRHLLVDTEGLVMKVRVHSAKVPDQDGIRLLLEPVRGSRYAEAGTRSLWAPGRLSHVWVEAGYRCRGRRWTGEVFGVSVEVVRKPPKPVPEEVAKLWAREWAKEGKKVDRHRIMPPRGFRVLPRRGVERTFARISHDRRMAKDYERLCVTGEAFVYAAITRLMVRRLARA
jgi:putative transposase